MTKSNDGMNYVLVGSPMNCAVIDGSQCVASGEGLRLAPVNKTAWFTVDPSGPGGGDCNVVVTGRF